MPSRHRHSYSMLQLGAKSRMAVNTSPWPLYTLDRDPVHTAHEAGWASGPVKMGMENTAHARARVTRTHAHTHARTHAHAPTRARTYERTHTHTHKI